ncbi:MAG: hypothetical protein ABIU87_03865, partial [Ornithinibacter sp.]
MSSTEVEPREQHAPCADVCVSDQFVSEPRVAGLARRLAAVRAEVAVIGAEVSQVGPELGVEDLLVLTGA